MNHLPTLKVIETLGNAEDAWATSLKSEVLSPSERAEIRRTISVATQTLRARGLTRQGAFWV